MSGKKVISIRFHEDNKEDMELYSWLEQEAGTSVSLASVVKTRIRKSYESNERMNETMGFQDKMISAVREEMQESGMKIVGALLSGMGSCGVIPIQPVVEESQLPEESGELPNGALEFLE